MPNRAARRHAQRQRSGYMRKSLEERKAQLFKNGITKDHLEKEYAAGYKSGENQAIQAVYCALMLAANEEFGFGANRVLKLVKATDKKLLGAIDSAELIQEVYDRFKIEMDFDAPIDRVQEA